MNAIIKISNCNFASASAKNAYNLTRQKNQKKYIITLEENPMPAPFPMPTPNQKKQIKNLQTKLSTYKKRLAKSVAEDKPKSIKTNQKNISDIEKKMANLAKFRDRREKYFTEFTIAVTHAKGGRLWQNWGSRALGIIKEMFPDLSVISAVEHRDQASPHLHILLYSPTMPITQVLANAGGRESTTRASMREAYSTIANQFHDKADGIISPDALEPLQKGRRYVSLGKYKSEGNKEAREALQLDMSNLKKFGINWDEGGMGMGM